MYDTAYCIMVVGQGDLDVVVIGAVDCVYLLSTLAKAWLIKIQPVHGIKDRNDISWQIQLVPGPERFDI